MRDLSTRVATPLKAETHESVRHAVDSPPDGPAPDSTSTKNEPHLLTGEISDQAK